MMQDTARESAIHRFFKNWNILSFMSANDYTFYNFYYLNYIRAVQYTQTTHRIVLMLVFNVFDLQPLSLICIFLWATSIYSTKIIRKTCEQNVGFLINWLLALYFLYNQYFLLDISITLSTKLTNKPINYNKNWVDFTTNGRKGNCVIEEQRVIKL